MNMFQKQALWLMSIFFVTGNLYAPEYEAIGFARSQARGAQGRSIIYPYNTSTIPSFALKNIPSFTHISTLDPEQSLIKPLQNPTLKKIMIPKLTLKQAEHRLVSNREKLTQCREKIETLITFITDTEQSEPEKLDRANELLAQLSTEIQDRENFLVSFIPTLTPTSFPETIESIDPASLNKITLLYQQLEELINLENTLLIKTIKALKNQQLPSKSDQQKALDKAQQETVQKEENSKKKKDKFNNPPIPTMQQEQTLSPMTDAQRGLLEKNKAMGKDITFTQYPKAYDFMSDVERNIRKEQQKNAQLPTPQHISGQPADKTPSVSADTLKADLIRLADEYQSMALVWEHSLLQYKNSLPELNKLGTQIFHELIRQQQTLATYSIQVPAPAMKLPFTSVAQAVQVIGNGIAQFIANRALLGNKAGTDDKTLQKLE